MMKTSSVIACLSILILTVPAWADDSSQPRPDLGDRIDHRLDKKGDRLNHRLDRKGDRIENRLDRKGDRIENRLDKKGARINERLDQKAHGPRPRVMTNWPIVSIEKGIVSKTASNKKEIALMPNWTAREIE